MNNQPPINILKKPKALGPIQIKFIRLPEVLKLTSYSKSTCYYRINEQLFVPPISLGGRSVAWICHEVDAVLLAMAKNKSKQEIQEIVRTLIAERQYL